MRSSACCLQALLPLTALGWRGPDAPMDEALAGYYPLTLMETGLGVGGEPRGHQSLRGHRDTLSLHRHGHFIFLGCENGFSVL